ncbi:MFS transporter [Paenibacillus senegalensis]|uniref:MFS transporter n=1 Tax=Paenibacillus senegalensis TaxID=1465766 RepID=UPI00028A2532|nr:MFS transporter [Paenibacillus senegalensis]
MKLVYALCFVLFFSVMNGTMFNVSLPYIAAEFELSTSAASWTITGYTVLYALGSLLFGKLADKYPLKRLITFGLLLFAAASALGFLAQSFSMVLIARLLQAAGASCIPALVMLIPVRYFPSHQRGKVMGIIASTMAFSSGIGPIAGGFITGQFHWTGLFLFSLAAPVALPFIRRSLPEEKVRAGEKVDFIGAGVLGLGVSAIMLSVTQFSFWWLVLGIAAMVIFIARMRKVANPFIRLTLLRIPGFASGLLISFIGLFIVFGIFIITPVMLKNVFALDAQHIGYILFPAAMLAALLGRFGGKMVDSRGSLFTLYVSFVALGVGLLGLSVFSGVSPWWILLCLPLINVPFTFVQAAMAKIISSILPNNEMGVGMGIYNLVNFLAGSISGAVLSKAIEFDWSWANVTAVGTPLTYGAVYMVLSIMALLNIGGVYGGLAKLTQPRDKMAGPANESSS